MMLTRDNYRAIKQKSKPELEAYLERLYTRAYNEGRRSVVGTLTAKKEK